MNLSVSGKFALDNDRNPPPLKAARQSDDGTVTVSVGRGVDLRLGRHPDTLDSLLDSRIVVDPDAFTGLGSVTDACAVFCTSNHCREWARKNGRPRTVAKIIGVMADEPRYVLLTQPRLQGAARLRRESTANRQEAGLLSFILIEPGAVECPQCPGRNRGEVTAT
jgi:hypothetical protein